ncbi:hypothetical protein [Actinoplanes solisilvae]|uniref:hypothetical protein n=1 Tax=Actinoplanes solisilvae TaxID=2486853 RepID=UPI000FD9D3C2|nr:hypothetical protein [Actinoplanes solisilvae]
MVETVKVTARGIVYEDRRPDLNGSGVTVHRAAGSFELRGAGPGPRDVFYRIHRDRLVWGTDLAALMPSDGPATPDPGTMLGLIQGISPAPDATIVPEVHRLVVGTTVRVSPDGISVGRVSPELPRTRRSPAEAVAAALHDLDRDFAIAYSGGLGSAFVAAVAAQAGLRPTLLHADLGLDQGSVPAAIAGLPVERVPVEVGDLLDHQWITGEEIQPPLPDVEATRRLTARLATRHTGEIVGGSLLADLASTKLPMIDAGVRGWRLLGCEPFHIAGTLPALGDARALLAKGVVYSPPGRGGPHEPEAQPIATPPPPSATGAGDLPGLTGRGRELFESAHRGSTAMWKEHLSELGSSVQRAVAGLQERGDGGLRLPALDPGVLAAVDRLTPRQLGRIRHGVFENHLPLRRVLAARGVRPAGTATPAYWLRLAATKHLLQEREKVVAGLSRQSALADLGLIEPAAVVRAIEDGHQLAQHALPILRLVWVDRWLWGRR